MHLTPRLSLLKPFSLRTSRACLTKSLLCPLQPRERASRLVTNLRPLPVADRLHSRQVCTSMRGPSVPSGEVAAASSLRQSYFFRSTEDFASSAIDSSIWLTFALPVPTFDSKGPASGPLPVRSPSAAAPLFPHLLPGSDTHVERLSVSAAIAIIACRSNCLILYPRLP